MGDDTGDDDRTVYQPKGGGGKADGGGKKPPPEPSDAPDVTDESSPEPPSEPVPDPGAGHEPTEIRPSPPPPAAGHEPTEIRPSVPPASSPPPTSPPPPAPAPSPAPPPPAPAGPRGDQQFTKGDVLNGIYRIERFLARGGMGEVYEARNVHQLSERVAIKVMLPHMAQDELVAAMFAKESEMLTRLHHEAIVPYRMAARDDRGRPYLVTEFIDGPSLEDRLGSIKLTDDEFADLAQKLAAGLGTAHSLGAIHRDIAPDNILLAEGDPARPKIIDFGIAKDATDSGATIVGDGFAGKLKYVAPEQLGEYDRNVGPWSDIYSLALTLRALAAGKPSDMGGSLSDAVRKRQSVPDLSDLSPRFHAAFEMALQPDPANRPQSMAEFNLRLREASGDAAATGFEPLSAAGDATRFKPDGAGSDGEGKPTGGALAGMIGSLKGALPDGIAQNRVALIGGGVAAVLLAVVGIVVVANLGGGDVPPPSDGTAQGAGTGQGQAGAQGAAIALGSPQFEQLAQRAIDGIECAWLTYDGSSGNTARFVGGAANPAAAQTSLLNALEGAGASSFSIDLSDVVRFTAENCAALDALREVRSPQPLISTPQDVYEAKRQAITLADGSSLEEQNYARVVIRIDNLGANEEVAFLGWNTADGIEALEPTRASLEGLANQMQGNKTERGFVLPFALTFEGSGKQSYGAIVLTGGSALPGDLVGRGTEFDEAWATRFRQSAQANGWKADAVWFSVEDQQAD
ncbi:serine/threonine-protein kinase [Erythrobacter sp. JK5]|uniref:serine/threonine-protein kinase n=1 Tax=Erythrobacter sp. JK5 TaxID=2829500 RepID=UPI001BAB5BAA|nr:serine/threonine-protein kinase [Erythrobacter sp. JK5]QUL36781.1 serine/threonine protein kinase [Erythrobacter sp. JK5]